MKNKNVLLIILILTAFCVTGCFTTSKPIPVRYSFAEDEDKTAALTFVQNDKVGVRLVDCEGTVIPTPAEGTYWDTAVLFPAERPLNIRVYVYWKEDQYGERRRGIFRCPQLEAGREYKLWFKGGYKKGSLILTYANVGSLYSLGKSGLLYEQEIPPLK